MNDLMAFIVIRAAALAGVRVPDELSIVGFDNLALAEHIDPPLTTVAQDPMSIGKEAARRLLALIEGEPAQDIWTLLPTQLVIRNSTAPAGGKEDATGAVIPVSTETAVGKSSEQEHV